MRNTTKTHFALLFGAAFSMAIGCAPAPGAGSADGGIGDEADGGVGQGDGGSANTDAGGGGSSEAGETCAQAPSITPGTVSGSSAGAADDYQGSCDGWSEGPGPDVVYSFTLTEQSGVNLSVTGYDSILYVFKGSECTEEINCADIVGADESLSFAALEAGDYFVVVDTFIGDVDEGRQEDGAEFTLTYEQVAPFCAPDQFDEDEEANNNTPEDAIGAGFADIDTADLDPDEEGDQGIELNLCEGDVDYWAIGHIGGALNVTVSGVNSDVAPTFELFSATANLEEGSITGYTEGSAINNNSDQARGVYLLKVSGDSLPNTGLSYSFTATHGCQGDADDSFVLELDDGSVANAPTTFEPTEEPVEKAVCGDDVDSVVLRQLVQGDITVTFATDADTSALNVEAFNVSEDDEGERTATALGANAFTIASSGGAEPGLVLTITDAAPGLYMVSISTTLNEDVEYAASVDFSGIQGAPANDTCETGATLVASNNPSPVFGRTIGATHSLAGPECTEDGESYSCNGDGEVESDSEVGPAPEVFYYLSLPEAKNLDVFVDGSMTEFASALYLLELPNQMCPADLSTLTPVSVDDEPICESGIRVRARIPQASGDYLVVVDGQYINIPFFGLEEASSGAFEIRARTYDGDFPPPQACQDATAIDMPTAGSPTTFTVTYDDAPEELVSEDCGGRGAERVFSFTPGADATRKITTGGGEDDVDTVVYLMEGACSEEVAAATSEENETCNDDGDGVENFGSLLQASVTAGTAYYLVVDAYSANAGSAGVTIELVD